MKLKTLLITLCMCSTADAFADDPVLTRIKESKVLQIGCDISFSIPTPFISYNKKTGTFEGFEAELANLIAEEIGHGVKAKIVMHMWDKVLETVRTGKLDIAMCQFFIPEKNKIPATDVYSIPYGRTGLVIAYSASRPPPLIDKLPELPVGIFNDPAAIEWTQKNKFKIVKIYDTEKELLIALKEAKIQAIIYDKPNIISLVRSNPKLIRSIDITLAGSESDYGIMVRSEASDLIQIINKAVQKWTVLPETKKRLQAAGL